MKALTNLTASVIETNIGDAFAISRNLHMGDALSDLKMYTAAHAKGRASEVSNSEAVELTESVIKDVHKINSLLNEILPWAVALREATDDT